MPICKNVYVTGDATNNSFASAANKIDFSRAIKIFFAHIFQILNLIVIKIICFLFFFITAFHKNRVMQFYIE